MCVIKGSIILALKHLSCSAACPAVLRLHQTAAHAQASLRHLQCVESNVWPLLQDGVTVPEGLWVEGSALRRDLAVITQRIRLLGFNAIRLPFSFQDLFNLSPR
jgi:hypothetical protein